MNLELPVCIDVDGKALINGVEPTNEGVSFPYVAKNGGNFDAAEVVLVVGLTEACGKQAMAVEVEHDMLALLCYDFLVVDVRPPL